MPAPPDAATTNVPVNGSDAPATSDGAASMLIAAGAASAATASSAWSPAATAV